MVLDVERLFRECEPAAFFVMPRVVRRVLQNELDITSPWLQPPHRKLCVVERDRLLWLVANDELGVADDAVLPSRIMLIARPEEDRQEKFTRNELLRYYWRRLFHARLDFELELKTSKSQMTLAQLRHRINALGQTQFDEIRSVLRSEQMLRRPDDLRHVYAEFVAVYHELRVFAPQLLPIYFPALGNEASVLQAIGTDCDATAILNAIRPAELASIEPVSSTIATPEGPAKSVAAENELRESLPVRAGAPSPKKFAALTLKADRLRTTGNNVRAASLRRRAFEVVPAEHVDVAQREMVTEIEYLVLRLQAALELTDDEVRPWLAMCERLLAGARRGFWSANARLLYDLQQVCLDHEQEIYRVDLLGWIISRGQRSLKRPLPNQRFVMMSKHLRSAALRVPTVLIDEAGRRELGDLLHAAADAAEHILRKRLEPLIVQSLKEAGFTPGSVVERVACRKVTQELLDGIVQRGFITLGDLRDGVSRNQLKMPDLKNAREFFTGDPLLQANGLFATTMDGVYQRGPFYLRLLQRLNSLAFGIPAGRALTKFFALPIGLAFLALMAAEEVAHLIVRKQPTPHVSDVGAAIESVHAAAQATAAVAANGHAVARHYVVYNHINLLWLSCFIFALIHGPKFRDAVILILRTTWKLVKLTVIELPGKIASFPLVKWILKSFPFLLFRRFLLTPLVATALLWKVLPALGVYEPLSQWWGSAIFFGSLLAFNSRFGRDTEELTREFVARTWYRIRVHLVVGLFTLIVDAFRWLMDGLERLLYAVDEWLRFRSGESSIALGVKAVLGVAWGFVRGVIRFCVTLLIEPQINPIKHFPVVTVSHKLVLGTLTIPLATLLEKIYDRPTAYTVTGLILSGIPGVFGFLAWEFKENWRLYAANRASKLRPVLVGHHGETLLRLLRPGFHSGTIPKLFNRRRRAARQSVKNPKIDKQAKFAEKLHHEAESVKHFVERELLVLLSETRSFREFGLSVERVDIATNRLLVTISHQDHPLDPMQIEFTEQSGWLMARVPNQGWLLKLSDDDRNVFRAALAGLYKLGSVGLVREQIESQLITTKHDAPASGQAANDSPRNDSSANRSHHPYDISAAGLVVWPHYNYATEVHYSLEERPTTVPRPRSLARTSGLTLLPLAAIVYRESPLCWSDWKAFWQAEQLASPNEIKLLPEIELLVWPSQGTT